ADVGTATTASTSMAAAMSSHAPAPTQHANAGLEAGSDTTIKHAIEFLAQEESESALVYALVHDPELRLATALIAVRTPNGTDAQVMRALLHVFDSYEDQLRKLIGLLMVQEMIETINWNELFRANSSTTAIVREYTCALGMDFLQSALQEVILELWDAPQSYEVNPLLLPPDADLAVNQQRLETLADSVLRRIFDSVSLFPYQIAKLYRLLEVEMGRLLEKDRKSLASRLSSIGEDMVDDFRQSNASSTASTVKEEFMMHLGGFLFLRFLCPALIMPHKMDLTPNGEPPSKALQRTLVLLAKLFQSLANNADYGSREPYMMPFNSFLTRNRPKLAQFYEQIGQQALNDCRRESMILRSNITPRISQIWMPPSRDTMGNLAGNGFFGTSNLDDDELGVLRRLMLQHVDFIAKEIGSTGRLRRRSRSVAMSPLLKKKRTTKRKLKTSKSVALPEEDEDQSVSSSETSSVEFATPLEPGHTSGAVTAAELDKLIGHTSHRDIQLMHIYYSKLSQSGLQSLLASDKERFVEMKAHVVIQATPRQVFQYLRSLEAMPEWDQQAANIRRVEPLDDSRVIMYRSHPKLSLWPTWLVKPRDSCDLHSFVEKTGREDTFAVMMESVPRPDVPELKGTVRMSYATGGFLIEPATASDLEPEADGVCYPLTKLTNVIRADFKGSLPRYLAEGICYRQVLSVRSIRSRIEADLAHADASWI
ncbi:TPA: hypothetical protein N0F65_000500, partial [Lagenidium giganteum]